MKKNRNNRPQEESSRSDRSSDRRSDGNRDRNATVILLLAFLFFLLGLAAFAQASGFRLFDRDGFNPEFGTRRDTNARPGQPGQPGAAGTRGTNGTGGTGGSNGGSGTNTEGGALDDLNVNVKSGAAGEVDAGIKDGQLNIDPNLGANPQGGSDAEVNVNEDKVLDTKSIFR